MNNENIKLFGSILLVGLLVIGGFWLSKNTPKGEQKSAKVSDVSNDEISVVPPNKNDYMQGGENAEIILVEYSDVDCPFCKRFHASVQNIVKKYDGKVSWAYRQFPLTIHPYSMSKSITSLCVGKNYGSEAFFDYTNSIMADNDSGSKDNALAVAKSLGFDETKIANCVANDTEIQNRISQEMEDATTAGLQGTPFTLVFNKDGQYIDKIDGAQAQITVEKLINDNLK